MQHVFTLFSIGTLLLVLIVLLLLLASLIFQFRWLVPFVPTPMPIVREMVNLANLKPGDHVIDLGAGDARFLIEAKKREPTITCVGYEGAIVVWMLGKIRIYFSGHRDIQFYCKDFMHVSLSDADVVFTYLSMHVMKMLIPKFQRELRSGTRLISHAFRLPHHEPAATSQVPMRFGGLTKAYLYRWNAEQQ